MKTIRVLTIAASAMLVAGPALANGQYPGHGHPFNVADPAIEAQQTAASDAAVSNTAAVDHMSWAYDDGPGYRNPHKALETTDPIVSPSASGDQAIHSEAPGSRQHL